MKALTTYYLEMNSASEMILKTDSKGLKIIECEIKQFEINRFLDQFIGENWGWKKWQLWSEKKWKSHIEDDNHRTWIAYYKGSLAGFYEIQIQDDGNVELDGMGLAPKFLGKGFGGFLFSQQLKSAWECKGTKRVWFHTSSNDHPNALKLYKACGMKVYRVETTKKIPLIIVWSKTVWYLIKKSIRKINKIIAQYNAKQSMMT